MSEAMTKANSSWRFDVEKVSLFVPGVIIDLKVDGARFSKYEWTVFIYHSDEAAASGSSVEPEEERVVFGVFLGFEEDVVELAHIKGKVT